MKNFLRMGFAMIIGILTYYNVAGQNPNWTMPPYKFDSNNNWLSPLPGSGNEPYDGSPSTHLDAAYSDDDGNLILFTVDEKVYDRNGNWVDEMRINNENKKGHSERLILPMGNDCRRYAIIYQASPKSNESYALKLDGRRIYMAIYNLDAYNSHWNPESIGALEYDASGYNNLVDISRRDALLHGYNGNNPYDPAYNNPPIYGFDAGHQQDRANFQIAATGLIDNCFYYVFIFDGKYIIRYKLTDTDLEYDDHVWLVPNSTKSSDIRSEMELIKLANGNYRIAIPKAAWSSSIDNYSVGVIDIDGTTGDIIGSKYHEIGLGLNAPRAEPYGLEFSPSGRFIYITHDVGINLPNALDVYDLHTNSFVNLPSLGGIENFRRSFIERSGDNMYLASENYIGKLSNIDDPNNLALDPTYELIPGGNYGNALGGFNPQSIFFRHMLPTQVDMPYPNLAAMSCDCCAAFNTAHDIVEVNESDIWDPNNNPFTTGSSDVYIKDELRIKAGTELVIDNMNFYFAPDARVVVERGDASNSGAVLNLRINSVFTADFRCSDNGVTTCGVPENCDKDYWQGVRVEGNIADDSQSSQKQATFTMSGGSMIEYAKTGIRVGHESLADYGGGILQIENSIFKDNITGIEFDAYARLSNGVELFNKSVIKSNTFKTTDDWFSDAFPDAHVFVKNSSGLNLLGNAFENTNLAQILTQRGIGVKAFDSRVKVEYNCTSSAYPCPPQSTVRSEFQSLYCGIYGLNNFSETRTLESNYNIFRNNEMGVLLSNQINPRILDNDFFLKDNSASTKGLYLLSSTGYVVENNYFEGVMGKSNMEGVGIIIRDSGPFYNEIYRNGFSRLYIGAMIEGKNAHEIRCREVGLKWFCNTFDKIWHSDIALKLDGTMSNLQGDCSVVPAGNMFSHSTDLYPLHLDLYNGNLGFVIRYEHHGNFFQYPKLVPATYSGSSQSTNSYFIMTPCFANYDGRSCPVKSIGKPHGPSQGPNFAGGMDYSGYAAMASTYANQLASMQALQSSELETESEELNALQAEARTFWHNLTMTYQWDTLGTITPEQMASLLTTQPESNERFASAFLGAENSSWVSTYAQAIANNTNLPALVNGELPTEIPSYFESDFFSNLGNTNALNTLYIENNAIYNPYVVLPPSFGSNLAKSNGDSNSSDPESDDQLSSLVVTPNPFTQNVRFDFSNYNFTGTNNRLEFYDLLGKKVYVQNLTENQSQSIVQGADLPEGVIIYTLYVTGEPAETGKVVKVK